MPWVKIFSLIFFLTQMTFASDHGGGHGEASPQDTNFSGKQTQQWSEVQAKLSALKSKVEAQENLVKSLTVDSTGSATESREALAARIEQLKKEHQKLQALTAEYNKMNLEYETKFPERGLKESRIYKRFDPQTVQPDKSVTSGYEERLQQLQNKIMRQYPKATENLKQTAQSKQQSNAGLKAKSDAKSGVKSDTKSNTSPDANQDTKLGKKPNKSPTTKSKISTEKKDSAIPDDVTEQIILQK